MRVISKPYIPFLAFLLIIILTVPFSFDFATSVVPGWHTTIYPPYFAWTAITMILLAFVTIGYWLLGKRTNKLNRILFILHVALTIPAVVFIKFPTLFLNIDEKDQSMLLKEISLRVKMISFAELVFVLAQVLFIIYFIRAVKR